MVNYRRSNAGSPRRQVQRPSHDSGRRVTAPSSSLSSRFEQIRSSNNRGGESRGKGVAKGGRQVRAPTATASRRRTYTTLSSRMDIDNGTSNNNNNHRNNHRGDRGRGNGRRRGSNRGGARRNVDQATLDKDLENFMLKDQKSGSAMLDQDLDSYMQQG